MKKLSCLFTRAICFLGIVYMHVPAHSQISKDTSTNWTAWMEKGKRQKTLGIVFMGVGAGFFTVCALNKNEGVSGALFKSGIAEQFVTGLLGVMATTSGVIAFFSGNAKVSRARMELGKTSYYVLPGYPIYGPSISFKINLGK